MRYNKINTVVLSFLFVSFFSARSSGQDNIETQIKEIRSEYDRINNDTAKFKMVQKDFFGHSSEGGVMKKYYDDKTLRMAELTLYGETGQSKTNYYIVNGQLIYLAQTELMYKTPLYMGKPEIKNTEENHLYFKDQKLIRWATDKNKIIDPSLYFEKQIETLLYFQTQILPEIPLKLDE